MLRDLARNHDTSEGRVYCCALILYSVDGHPATVGNSNFPLKQCFTLRNFAFRDVSTDRNPRDRQSLVYNNLRVLPRYDKNCWQT